MSNTTARPARRHVCVVRPNARAARRAVVLAWVAQRSVHALIEQHRRWAA